MAERPKVTVDVEIAGAKQGINDLQAVADAQQDVGAAAAQAGVAADKAGKLAEGARSRWGRLVDGLKAGAGAAASASAGIAGMAATLNGDLSDANKTAVAGLQGLSGVLGAFGPLGSAVATVVSLAAGALASFGKTAEEANQPTMTLVEEFRKLGDNAGFLAKALGPAIAEIERFAAARERLKTARDLSSGIFGVPVEDVPEQWGAAAQAMQGSVSEAVRVMEAAQAAIDDWQAVREQKDANYFNRELTRLEGVAAKARRQVQEAKEAQKQVTDAFKLQSTPLGPELPPGGLSAGGGGGRGGPARPNWQAAYQAEVDAALAATEAIRQDRETDIYLQISAADALAAQVVRTAAEMQSAWSQAWYSSELEQAIASSVTAQRDAIQTIEAEASLLTGIYDQLTSGVQAFGAAALEGFAAASVGAAIYGGSQLEVANKALQAATVTAATESAIALAKAGGYYAAGIFGYLPGFAAAKASLFSAATWGALAGGGAALTAATGGFGGGGGGGGGPGLGGMSPDRQGRPEDFGERRFEQAEPTELRLNLGSGQAGMSRQDAAALLGALGDLVRSSGSDGGALLSPRRR